MYKKTEIVPMDLVKSKAVAETSVITAVGAMLYGSVVTITGAVIANVKGEVTHT